MNTISAHFTPRPKSALHHALGAILEMERVSQYSKPTSQHFRLYEVGSCKTRNYRGYMSQDNMRQNQQGTPALPQVIQGGMGIAVSHYGLANAVSRTGQLGVISGTGIDNVLVRRLQDGDPSGDVRRALAHFPLPEKAQEIIKSYYIEGGRATDKPYKRVPLPNFRSHRRAWELLLIGCFVEIWLAREGHDNPVGLNLLTKLQMTTLPTLYGAMLAGVDTVIMGAGIPREIPAVLDAFAAGEPAKIKLDMKGDTQDRETPVLHFDPADYGFEAVTLERPKFYPIITSHVLANALTRRATSRIDGFVIEEPSAGGHNAPPRGKVQYDEIGQPIYTERDECDLAAMRKIGLPFWLAGDYGTPEAFQRARDEGATGVQLGTLFAYCTDSGFSQPIREKVLGKAAAGELEVYTDPLASPTGFPFKVLQVEGTLADEELYQARQRVCDIGYLRESYWTDKGDVGWRCASEPVKAYISKGGSEDDAKGRKCLCNALMADVGLAQIQKGGMQELPLMTSGDVAARLGAWKAGYSAADVIHHILGDAVDSDSDIAQTTQSAQSARSTQSTQSETSSKNPAPT